MDKLTVEQRFWLNVVPGSADECWVWKGFTRPDGYGTCWDAAQRRSERAHRVSWAIHMGPIPEGLAVLHRCDNPPCVNPNHLFLGTRSDNSADKVAKGRQARGPAMSAAVKANAARGERHGMTTLTFAQVEQIRARVEERPAILAAEFGVSRQTIVRIIKRQTWTT